MGDRSVWLLRRLITLAVVAVAMFALRSLWTHSELLRGQRDGRVRADVVSIAPDVPGFVVKVAVHDNQVVSKGDPLFEIDRARYEIALQQALATVARATSFPREAGREAHRNDSLGEVVSSRSARTESHSDAGGHRGAAAGLADLAAARLNLQRTLIVGPRSMGSSPTWSCDPAIT